MASTHKSLRSSTADKRPTTSIADGQIALNTNAASPGLFFKDSAGTDIIKVGPVHVGTTAPNATPATGGSSGNSTGEVWLDTSLTPVGVKIWNGSSWENATPAGSTTIQGLLELATNAETQTGTDTARAVTPAGLQSKVSDSTSTTSSTTIASSTAVKSAYDLANAALPKTGGTITGALEIGTTGSLVFEGATANDFETTVAVTDPTADRTVTIPNQSGNFLISGNASIVNADVNASAAIAGTKISPNFGAQTLVVDTNVLYVDATTNRVGIGTSSAGTDLDVNSGSANCTIRARTGGGFSSFLNLLPNGSGSGVSLAANADSSAQLFNQLNNYLAFGTNNTERLRIDSSGRVGVGTSSPAATLHSRADNAGTGSTPLLIQNRSISANTAVGISFVPNTSDTADRSAIIYGVNSSGGSGNATDLAFHTNANGGSPSEKARITSSGRLGVGTSSPAYNAHITNSGTAGTLSLHGSSGIGYLLMGNTDTSSGPLVISSANQVLAISRGNSFSSAGGGTLTESVRIDSSGRVGVGTSSPGHKLVVSQNNSGGIAAIHLPEDESTILGSTANTNIKMGGNMTVSASGVLGFNTNGTERMRIDSSGRLKVGTTADIIWNQTSVDGVVIEQSGATQIVRNGDVPLLITRNTSTGQIVKFSQAGTERGSILYDGDFGISSAGNLTFDTSGTEKARIDSSGRVGIGTSSPDSICTVTGGPIRSKNVDGDSGFDFQENGSAALIRQRNNRPMVFYTNNSEKARIDGSGNVGINVSNPSAGASATSGLAIRPGSHDVWFNHANGVSSGIAYAYFSYNSGAIGSITQNGTTAVAYNTTSDYRLKENVIPVTDGIYRLQQLKPSKFNFIADPDRTVDGFIAHEVQTVVPEAITGEKDAVDDQGSPVYQGIDQSKLVPLLTAALQEAIAKIEVLEAKVAALEVN